jgi:hypothetical protein
MVTPAGRHYTSISHNDTQTSSGHMLHGRIAFLAVAAVLLVGPVNAQSATQVAADSTAVVAVAPVAAPVAVISGPAAVAVAPVSVMFKPLRATDVPAPIPIPPSSRSKALMILGGAGLVVGALVGGDEGSIIMVGGAVVGLIGVWKYFK